MRDVLNPLFRLADMTQVFVSLEELTLLIHPISSLPAIATSFHTARPIRLVCALETSPAFEARDLLFGRCDVEAIGCLCLGQPRKSAQLARRGPAETF